MVRFTNLLKSWIIIFSLMISYTDSKAQSSIEGPVIRNYGETYLVHQPEYQPDFDKNGLKAVFDITAMGNIPQNVSTQINTIARCINMHAQSGLPVDKMDIKVVFHSQGTYTILNQEAYLKRYGEENPPLDLFRQLSELDVELYVCGQSLSARGIGRNELYSDIRIALSAMTVLTDLQMKGYALIKF